MAARTLLFVVESSKARGAAALLFWGPGARTGSGDGTAERHGDGHTATRWRAPLAGKRPSVAGPLHEDAGVAPPLLGLELIGKGGDTPAPQSGGVSISGGPPVPLAALVVSAKPPWRAATEPRREDRGRRLLGTCRGW